MDVDQQTLEVLRKAALDLGWSDYTDTHGADAGETFLAIYSLEDNKFIFCAASEGQERPTEFETRPGEVPRTNQREPSGGPL